MSRLAAVPKPSILRHTARTNLGLARRAERAPSPGSDLPRRTFTGTIGAICMYPLRAIIRACVALRIHPNTLTLIGVIVNVVAAWALGFRRFVLAGIALVATRFATS